MENLQCEEPIMVIWRLVAVGVSALMHEKQRVNAAGECNMVQKSGLRGKNRIFSYVGNGSKLEKSRQPGEKNGGHR